MDIEPDDALSILVDVVFRRCQFIDNNGAGVIIDAAKLDHDVDAPVSILFEDCAVSWSSAMKRSQCRMLSKYRRMSALIKAQQAMHFGFQRGYCGSGSI